MNTVIFIFTAIVYFHIIAYYATETNVTFENTVRLFCIIHSADGRSWIWNNGEKAELHESSSKYVPISLKLDLSFYISIKYHFLDNRNPKITIFFIFSTKYIYIM